MNLSDVRKAKIPRKKKFPAGRGHSSGLGKYCGRGHKGQGSRQGESLRVYFEGGQMPIIRRLPKRGFNNAEFRRAYECVNVGALDRVFGDGETVDEAALRSKGLVRRALPIKILGDGPLARKLTVNADRFTKSAEEKIVKAGGSVVKRECAANPSTPTEKPAAPKKGEEPKKK
jgi:large subunit ribosomal protein L15